MAHRPSHAFLALLVGTASVFGTCAHAGVAPAASGPGTPDGAAPPAGAETVVQDEVALRGVVAAVDVEGRRITLDTAAGSRVLPVGPGVPGLDRIRVGDVVDVRYHRSVLFDVQPAGSAEPGAYISEAGRPAAQGGVVGEQQVTVLATVVEVDAAAGTFSVQGPSGNVRLLRAETPEHRAAVARIRVGDLLRVRFREGVAVSLAQVEQH